MYPEAPRVSIVMSGPRFPLGQVLMWMGCLVWNYDILLDGSHDVSYAMRIPTLVAERSLHRSFQLLTFRNYTLFS